MQSRASFAFTSGIIDRSLGYLQMTLLMSMLTTLPRADVYRFSPVDFGFIPALRSQRPSSQHNRWTLDPAMPPGGLADSFPGVTPNAHSEDSLPTFSITFNTDSACVSRLLKAQSKKRRVEDPS